MRRPAAPVAVLVLTIGVVACADDSGRSAAPTSATGAATTTPQTTVPATTTTAAPAPKPTLAWHVPDNPLQLTEFPFGTGDEATYERDRFDGFSDVAYLGPLDGAFEVTAHRADYESPIAASARLAGRRLDLPAEAVSDWSGLADFLAVSITDASGTERLVDTVAFCPDDGDRIRVAASGPVEDLGGSGCSSHPFSLGASWAIAEGWAVGVTPFLEGRAIEPGDYDLTISIAPSYAAVLGEASVTIPVEIVLSGSEIGVDSEGQAFSDVVIDVDGDGIDDAEDDFVDGDGDGLDDRSSADLFVDLDGDGFDDYSGLDEADALARGEQVSDQTIDGSDPEATEPAHDGRTGPDADPPKQALPDLASLPALDIQTFVDPETGRDLLGFAAITWNRGPAPMVVDGFALPDRPGFMAAYQQFGRVNGRDIGSAPIGTLEYHAGGGHDHWHFLAFSRYDLVTEDGTEVQRSGKEAWCLADTDAIDTTRPGTVRTEATTLASACGEQDALWVRETLAVGWGDTYVQDVSGQAFDITDLPNGRYLIRLTANPDGSIYEGDTTNNVADRLVILGGTPGDRTVEVPPVGLVDTEASVDDPAFGGE